MVLILRVFVMAVSVIVFFGVIYMLVKRNLNESNSILWMGIGFVTLISGCFPGIIDFAANTLGIDYPPTLLFLFSTILLMGIAFKSSMEISKAEARINEIAITLSILREENNRLSEQLSQKPVETEKYNDRNDDTQ